MEEQLKDRLISIGLESMANIANMDADTFVRRRDMEALVAEDKDIQATADHLANLMVVRAMQYGQAH